ncbi:hypothetical protein D3C80_1745170 [compost metagenome]
MISRVNDIRLNKQIVSDEIRRIFVVSCNSAHFCSREKDIINVILSEEILHLLPVAEIQL